MTRARRWFGAVAALAVVAAAGCGGDDDAPYRLVVTGSSTVAPLVAEIAKRFEAANPEVRIDVQTGGSSRGIADVRRGLADVGMISRGLRSDESDLLGFAIARDGICLIVHTENPIGALSREQVMAIYTGSTTRWSELGGDDLPITVVHKAEGRSTLELFLEHFGLDNRAVRPSVVIGDNEQGIKTVAGDPAAIGYVSIGAAEVSRSLGEPLRLLPLEGVEASTDTLSDGSFPLARPLTLVVRDAPTGWTDAFLAYARSTEVADLVAALSFAPIR